MVVDGVARERRKHARELIALCVERELRRIGGIVRQAAENRLRTTEYGDALQFAPCHAPADQVEGLERAGGQQGSLVGGDLHNASVSRAVCPATTA